MPTYTAMYTLIRQLPGTDDGPGDIRANLKAYPTPAYAARAAAMGLAHATGLAKGVTYRKALPRLRRPGVIWNHDSGWRFRVLEAHYTADGELITPGLRVFCYYDSKWGTVEETQFFGDGILAPGGSAFDGWYLVRMDDAKGFCRKFNGERLAVKELPR